MQRKKSFYEVYIKRLLDIIISLHVIFYFGWLYVIVAILVRIGLGKPIVFKQVRPGLINSITGEEKLFYMYKFRTMTNERDEKGCLLPDEQRMNRLGTILRHSSLDELPEFVNILKGEMSLVGPRPQLVRDMVFMSSEQRTRHTVKPGLTGLAQVNGRNAISWEEKIEWDLKYIDNISFAEDLKIIFLTIKKVFGRKESSQELDVTDDYGDVLLKAGKVKRNEYDELQMKAQKMIIEFEEK